MKKKTKAVAGCTQMSKMAGGYGASVKGVLFQRGEQKKFCVKLPKAVMPEPRPGVPSPSPLIEWTTVNKGNTSCGVLRMKVKRPDKPDILGNNSKRRAISQGPQPGAFLTYTDGQWVATYTLVEPCRPGLDRWDLYVSWSVK